MKLKLKESPMIRTSAGGFTLLEILIVVGILALLAGLIFPVFSRARDSVRTANCASNLKQIGLAFKLYVGDNRGFHPSPSAHLSDCGWAEQIYPYAKSTAIFSCPADEFGEFRVGCPPTDLVESPFINWDGSYDFNVLPGLTGRKTFNEARIRNPSATILFCDGRGVRDSFSSEEDSTFSNGVPISPRDFSNLGNRHNYGSNVAYADGHVKWKSHEDLLDVKQWKH